MEREIAEQPHLLASNAERYLSELKSALEGRLFDMVLLVARGSSDHAAVYARYLIEIHLGIPVSLAAPSVVTRYGVSIRYPRCLAVGISQSGAAPDVAEVLSAVRAQGHTTLGITNTAGSRVATTVELHLDLGAGDERSVAATKTYSASLLAIHQLVAALGGTLPSLRLPDEAWLQTAAKAAEAQAPLFLRNSRLFSLARGYGFATALEAALKLMECALLPCKPYSTADFEHGPKALAFHGSAALVFGDAPQGLEAQGCEVAAAPRPKDVAAEHLPLWDALFAQLFALDLARSRGLDPDQPAGLNKVTKTL